MRRNLVTLLILAGLVCGCASGNGLGANSGRSSGINIDPGRSKSCYGGPVYVPC